MIKEAKRELKEMMNLIDRMDNHYTIFEAEKLNEEVDELDARGRQDIPVSDFPSEIQKVKGGTKCTIGYVSSANLDIPQIKKVNPATNRMKNYPDWATFGKNLGVQEEIGGVIKFARYSINWRSPENMRKHYNKMFVEPANAIRSKYGLAPMDKRPRQDRAGIDTDANGLPTYMNQDTGKGSCVAQYFLVATDGHIIKEIPANDLVPYFKKYSTSGVADLRKLNKSDDEIKAYVDEISKLNFRYTRFNYASIAYVITSINGEKKRFFNDELSDDIKGTGVNPAEFIEMAKKMYKLDLEKTANDANGEFDDEYPDED